LAVRQAASVGDPALDLLEHRIGGIAAMQVRQAGSIVSAFGPA
jgi:hypothetical protein